MRVHTVVDMLKGRRVDTWGVKCWTVKRGGIYRRHCELYGDCIEKRRSIGEMACVVQTSEPHTLDDAVKGVGGGGASAA